MLEFDDSRLDDASLLATRGDRLRHLALAGARLRRAAGLADVAALTRVAGDFRPRALIALGPEARFIRAVLEPTCPVPFVAWSRPGLPAWVGPLDLVVIVAGDPEAGDDSVHEALRRGAVVFSIGPEWGALPEFAVDRSLAQVVTGTEDVFVNAVIALAGLELLGLAPAPQLARVADALDAVAEDCSPHIPLGQNPAKDTAVCLADTSPIIWGGTVLAARASRRLAEAIRQVSHRAALAADATELLPVLAGAMPPDPFADPFLDPAPTPPYCLVLCDDASEDPRVQATRRDLESLAESRGVRVALVHYTVGAPVERYACLLHHGLFAAAFLDLGLV
ncbi:MAG: hypothetical protein LBR33_03165 [Propionibacteriaceae bacterium]|jgi:hypothetical protein|nr:hypothetical protein [Propionibacteriaceae bacterium]